MIKQWTYSLALICVIITGISFMSCQGKTDTTKPADEIVTETREMQPAVEKEIPSAQPEQVAETQEQQKSTDNTTTKTIEKRTLAPGVDGEISHKDGTVIVTRNEKSVPNVAVGTGIENYDIIKTENSSEAEMTVISPRAPGTIITVSENTCFTFELDRVGSRDTTTIDMVTGTIGLKVSALAGTQDVRVQTGETSLGVRGTSFTVTTVPDGSMLVTCTEGKVEAIDSATGSKAQASAGTVVEAAAGAGLRKFSVPAGETDSYRENWYTEKVRLLKKDALAQIRKHALDYEKRKGRFTTAYAKFATEKGVVDKWKKEDAAGKTGSTIEKMKEKKVIIKHLFALRKELFWTERLYFRLMRLKSFHDAGFGRGEIREGLSTEAFFSQLGKDDMEARIAEIRYVMKLYAQRNDGSVPADVSTDESEDDFFAD